MTDIDIIEEYLYLLNRGHALQIMPGEYYNTIDTKEGKAAFIANTKDKIMEHIRNISFAQSDSNIPSMIVNHVKQQENAMDTT
jgi:hypothetical protein